MRDWYVDGHYVRAATEQDAHDDVVEFYGHRAELVRPWTDEDQEDTMACDCRTDSDHDQHIDDMIAEHETSAYYLED